MPEKKKILFVLGGLACGGAERISIDIVSGLSKDLFSVDYLVPFNSDSYYKDMVEQLGCKIHYGPRFLLYNFFQYRKWMKVFLGKNKYDIIHFNQVTMVTSIADIVHGSGAKIVTHVHSSYFRGSKLAVVSKKISLRGIVKVADYCIACSEQAGDSYYGKDFLDNPKCLVLPNAINVKRFKFNTQKREEIRKKYNLSNSIKVIGCIGSLTPPKNHKFLIEVFSKMYAQNKGIRLLLVGDGILRNDLEGFSKQTKCNDGVIFAGSQQNVEDFYSAIDVFVLPAIFEGFSLATLEAQTNGLPCVVSDNIPEVALVCKNSICVLPLCSSEWENKINEMSQRERVLSNCSEIEKQYGIKNYISQIEKIYTSTLISGPSFCPHLQPY